MVDVNKRKGKKMSMCEWIMIVHNECEDERIPTIFLIEKVIEVSITV